MMLKINIHKEQKNNLSYALFIVGYILLCICFFMRRVVLILPYLKLLKIIAVLLLAINCIILYKSYTKKDKIVGTILMLLAVISYYFSKDNALVVLFLCVISSKNISTSKIIKADICIKSAIVIILFILSQLGLTNEYHIYRESMMRLSFGFEHPNAFAIVIATIFMEILYIIKKQKNKVLLFISIIIFTIIINYYADSRAAIVLLLATYIGIILDGKIMSKIIYNKITQIVIMNMCVIFTIMTMIMTVLYYKDTYVGIKLNEILSGRLEYNVNFLKKYDLNLFGNNLIFINDEEQNNLNVRAMILDNAYLRLILQYGFIMYMVFCYLMFRIFKNAYKKKDTKLILILFLFGIHGIVEASLFKFTINIFLIFLSNIILENDKEDSNHKALLVEEACND